MANKKRVLRRPGRGSSSANPAPDVIAALADPESLEGGLKLRIRIGNSLFGDLEDTDEGVAEGIKRLRRLWPLHAETAAQHCIRRFGPGRRPSLWWGDKQRPFVKPRDWTKPGDFERFADERCAADLAYLRKNNLLSKEEIAMLEAKKNQSGSDHRRMKMKLSEIPTRLVRALAARCQGYDAVLGDNRIILKNVASICLAEIDRRIAGADFPELDDETVAALDAQITKSGPAEFARLIFELEE